MASAVIETHDSAVAGGGDVVFCVIILCMSVLSLVILAASSAVGSGDGEGEGEGEGKRRRRSGSRGNGPVFVGGRGCACGGCRAGAGVCGTYLS